MDGIEITTQHYFLRRLEPGTPEFTAVLESEDRTHRRSHMFESGELQRLDCYDPAFYNRFTGEVTRTYSQHEAWRKRILERDLP